MAKEQTLGPDETEKRGVSIPVEDSGAEEEELCDLGNVLWKWNLGKSALQNIQSLCAELNFFVATTVVEAQETMEEGLKPTNRCSELQKLLDTKTALNNHVSCVLQG